MRQYFSLFLFLSLFISVLSLSVMTMFSPSGGHFTDQNIPQYNLFSPQYNEFGDTYDIYFNSLYDHKTEQLNLTITGRLVLTGIITGNTTELRVQAINQGHYSEVIDFDYFELSAVSESVNQSEYGFTIEKTMNLPTALVDRILVHLSINLETEEGENSYFSLDISNNVDVCRYNSIRIIYFVSIIVSLLLVGVLLGQPNSSPFHIMIQGTSLFSNGIVAQIIITQTDEFGFSGLELMDYIILPLLLLVIPFIIDMRSSQKFIKKINSRADVDVDQIEKDKDDQNPSSSEQSKPFVNVFVRNELFKHFSKRTTMVLVVVLLVSIFFNANRFVWMLGLSLLVILVFRPVDYIDF